MMPRPLGGDSFTLARARLGAEKAEELEALLVEKTRWTLNSGQYGEYSYMNSDWCGLL